jgi:hypothetical protein
MSTARLTDNLSEVLANAKERVTIRAADGRVIGFFDPYDDQADIPSPYTDEQLEEFRRNKGTCRPLQEVLKRIGAQ